MGFKEVIHTVGPIWKADGKGLDEELEKAVRAALMEGDQRRHRTLALPALSCGVYGFPIDQAAKIILSTIMSFLKISVSLEVVCLVSGTDTVRKFHSVLSTMIKTETLVKTDQDDPARSGMSLSVKLCC
jgi:O-acetyl-ADP-ribose deacetylase (regulator of RNase III)